MSAREYACFFDAYAAAHRGVYASTCNRAGLRGGRETSKLMQAQRMDHVATDDIRYIRQHWALLAASAWHGYLCYGRGIVVIDMAHRPQPLVAYHTDRDLAGAHPSGASPLSESTLAQMRSYDPQREVMYLLLHSDTTITTYRMSTAALPPPAAYACIERRAAPASA